MNGDNPGMFEFLELCHTCEKPLQSYAGRCTCPRRFCVFEIWIGNSECDRGAERTCEYELLKHIHQSCIKRLAN